MPYDFHVSTFPPRALLHASGELDIAARADLHEVLAALRLCGCTRLELDLCDVTFIDASTLGVLHDEQRRLLVDGGSLTVVAGSAYYALVARLAGYDALAVDAAPGGSTRVLSVLRTGA